VTLASKLPRLHTEGGRGTVRTRGLSPFSRARAPRGRKVGRRCARMRRRPMAKLWRVGTAPLIAVCPEVGVRL
jgi:hypothetical protein